MMRDESADAHPATRRAARRSALACVALLALTGLAHAAPDQKNSQPTTSDTKDDDLGPRKPGKPAPPSTFPRLADGKPDFTGIWFAGVKDLVALDDANIDIPMTPDFQAVRLRRQAATAKGHPYPDFSSTCQAFGMPRIMDFGTIEFVSRPEEIWVIAEVMHEVRRIYLDGKPHGQDVDKNFDGISVGRWEGDVLAVHTTKLRESYFDMAGAPHSDRLVIDERIRFINKDSLEDSITMTDPVALTRPWTVDQYYARRPADYEIQEYICNENLRSGVLKPNDPDADPAHMLPKAAVSDEK